MEGRDFISVAKSLLASPKGPAFVRSAISRAYYAAHLYSCHALRQFGCPKSGASARHDKWVDLSKSSDADIRGASQKLSDLCGLRHDADYEMHKSYVEKQANGRKALEDAESIIRALGACESRKDADRIGADLRSKGVH
jgi:hypothetical protein